VGARFLHLTDTTPRIISNNAAAICSLLHSIGGSWMGQAPIKSIREPDGRTNFPIIPSFPTGCSPALMPEVYDRPIGVSLCGCNNGRLLRVVLRELVEENHIEQ